MKMPRFVKMGEVSKRDGVLCLSLSINKWHPAFWLIVLKALWQTIAKPHSDRREAGQEKA